MPNPTELMTAAVQAVPETGEIPYTELIDKLVAEGNKDAVPFIAEAKKRGFLVAKLRFVDGVVHHTYTRGS